MAQIETKADAATAMVDACRKHMDAFDALYNATVTAKEAGYEIVIGKSRADAIKAGAEAVHSLYAELCDTPEVDAEWAAFGKDFF